MRRNIMLISVLFCFGMTGCMAPTKGASNSKQSFFQFVGETDWNLGLKDFVVSLEKDNNVFELRLQGYRYLAYSVYPKGEVSSNHFFGPLQLEHTSELSALLEYALVFVEQKPDLDLVLNFNWEMYPESITKWARIWQDSDLRKKWNTLDQHFRYQKLMEKITAFIQEDTRSMVQALGFEPSGASMEKMSFVQAQKIKYYQELLEPAGISKKLKIPIPLMLSIKLKHQEKTSLKSATKSEAIYPIAVDYIFAVAENNSDTVFASFHRSLDEYEITGSLKQADGTYANSLPMSQNKYLPIASQLLQACLYSTQEKEPQFFPLRMNLRLYPELYQAIVQHFTRSPGVPQEAAIVRAQLSNSKFYEYEPLLTSGTQSANDPFLKFKLAIEPFLKQTGYGFHSLQISVESNRLAKDYWDYEKMIKPLGFKPEDKLVVPDSVYMIVEKK